ncbi:Hint domain-containing protein [Acetobacter senegalensis]|uniref:Hint domain-containing protein n=1 Tax=Acetobacter senegalensis TaxID=446692 RepID=UPI0026536CD5|nr:Hint domain-containing protein [Acetobacter senegalensis]MDN7353273.1 Hint domain-containing protein [Acetobacter senegalensis]
MADLLPPNSTQTIAAGTTVSGASYSTQDHIAVAGTLTDATLTQTGGGIGSIAVQNGGAISGITVETGGNVFALAGGSASNISLDGSRSAALVIDTGGYADTVSASNSAVIDARGGTLSNATLVAGATMDVASGASVTSVSAVGASTSIDFSSGGQGSNITVSNGGSIWNAGGTLTCATIGSGGSAFLDGGSIAGAIIENGGELQVDRGTATDVGLKTGGRIDFTNLTYDSSARYNYDSETHTLTVTGTGGTASVTLDPASSDIIPGQSFQFVRDDDGSLVIETCFLAGSMIETPRGDSAVENLRLGDDVFAYVNGRPEKRRVIWAGKAHATVRPDLPDDEAGYPVRILKNAIADGVPYKDMLITAEHCLFFDGRFVPVRMLVNGRSIFYDKSIFSYDYYHIETEQHSVLKADGMLTESYLDTGNRRSFRQDGRVITLGGKTRSWEHDAGAPLCVDRAFVEPLFHALACRKSTLIEYQNPAPEKAPLLHDPDLRLVTERGATIRPVRHRDEQYSFMLPSGTQSVRILSRASRPTDVIGPFVDDRRQMGVAVGEVSLVTAKGQQTVTTHLQENKPEGWHADMGWNGVAWTNGNALLPLDAQQVEGDMALLSLTIRAAGPYLAADTTKQAVQATSIA